MLSKVMTQISAATLMFIIVPIVPAASVSAQRAERAVQVTSSADVAAVASVNKSLNLLVEQAAACKTPGMACACGLKPGLHRLAAAYHAALNSRPNWKDEAVQYVMQADGRSITIAVNFPAIRRQLDICAVP